MMSKLCFGLLLLLLLLAPAREINVKFYFCSKHSHTHTHNSLYIKISQSFHYLCHAIYKNIRKMVFMMIVCGLHGQRRRRKKKYYEKKLNENKMRKIKLTKKQFNFGCFSFNHTQNEGGSLFFFIYMRALF